MPSRLQIALEKLTPANALVFKTVRLRALQESPRSFSSTYAKESAFPDDEWMARSVRWSRDGFISYLAFDGPIACGMVGCTSEGQEPQCAHVVSMWVDPTYRRAGVGTILIDALRAWAKNRRLLELTLKVTSVNQPAIKFYERLGFRMTGETSPYPNDLNIMEYKMTLDLHP
jgi:ribosomal protein S18 acetylase RimI-like enzyme